MRSPSLVLVGLVGVLALTGCGGAAPSAPAPTPTAQAPSVQVNATFTAPPGTAVTYDQVLVPPGSHGAVSARSDGGSTTVMLAVRGLQPSRRYGAHAHTQPCGASGQDAGPHFQNMADPVQPSVDPQFANPQNEIWLDLTTDVAGAGSAESTVAWAFPADRRARSVVIHALPTATEPGKAGTAGDRTACISVDF